VTDAKIFAWREKVPEKALLSLDSGGGNAPFSARYATPTD
jgi:hypothetical protein